jgi:hypothetical protein
MGSFSNFMENGVLDTLRNVSLAFANPHTSLHTADPGETGANEVSGGSYARQPTAFDAAASGQTQNTAQEQFTNMPAVTIVAVGIWDALSAGNFLGFGWLGGHAAKIFTSGTDDVITSPAHGYSNDDRVVFSAEDAGSLPTGLSAGTLYWVRDVATDTFKVSATQGGAAIDLTTLGSGKVRKVVPKVVNLGDTVQIAAGDLDLFVF